MRLASKLENIGYDGQGRIKLPRAILFDLDDTILVAFGSAQSQWQRTIAAFADRLGSIEAADAGGLAVGGDGMLYVADTHTLFATPLAHAFDRGARFR